MRLKALFIAAAAAGLIAAGGAEAMPVAGLSSVEGAAPLVQVRGGCGFGEHRGLFGGCRLNRGWRGRLRYFRTGAPRGCPPGRTRIRGICRFVR
ncbi:GCG_CRPN prefix-to-repeats domain-containing protein [Lichenibacterium dinghuense]|uniref:GCG_CRPN prefix-to-repeats domain-containing protein n=1 Tax=Lichenibacterium dinghuense TaxID=2895977 RepID=UPI001F4516B5|nr:hypothetical protein [Lichenibacterium sp. 6Y81]